MHVTGSGPFNGFVKVGKEVSILLGMCLPRWLV